MITLTYFSFTTLSTVGLGDLHPRSNIERLVGTVMMLFGVVLASFITETIYEIIIKV